MVLLGKRRLIVRGIESKTTECTRGPVREKAAYSQGDRVKEQQMDIDEHQWIVLVCSVSSTYGQLSIAVSRLLQGYVFCTCFMAQGGDQIYEIRCVFVAVGLNALFIVLPHWDNMSQCGTPQSHMILTPG